MHAALIGDSKCFNVYLFCSAIADGILFSLIKTPQGTTQAQPYWPKDSEILYLACHNCAHLSSHWEYNIHMLGVQSEDPSQQPSVFWRVNFSCSHEHCGLPIVVHTRTEGGLPRETVAALASNVTPKPQCPVGHADNATLVEIVKV